MLRCGDAASGGRWGFVTVGWAGAPVNGRAVGGGGRPVPATARHGSAVGELRGRGDSGQWREKGRRLGRRLQQERVGADGGRDGRWAAVPWVAPGRGRPRNGDGNGKASQLQGALPAPPNRRIGLGAQLVRFMRRRAHVAERAWQVIWATSGALWADSAVGKPGGRATSTTTTTTTTSKRMRNGAKSTHPAVMGAPLWIARAFSRQRRADAERSDAPSTGGSVTERTIHHSAGHYVASVRTRQLLDAMEERLATLPLRTETVPHDPTVTAPNAAVLVLLCRPHGGSPATGEELAFALTERSKTVRTHRGEMSFPGGKLRQGDTSVLQTALRETCEEIGLEPRHVRVLGQFHEYRPLLQSSNLRVATFIGYMNDCVDPSALRVNPQEVKNLFIVPQRLFRLCRHLTSNTDARTPECSTTSDEHGKVPCTAIPAGNAADASNGVHEAAELPTENGTIYFALPHHCTGGKLVWGMTARIIDEVMQFMAECS